MDRRSFLSESLLAGISMYFYPDLADLAESGHSLFFSESGLAGDDQGRFVIGVLISKDPPAHLSRLLEIRRRHSYRSVFNFRSSDRYKFQFLRDVVDFFFSSDDLLFQSIVLGGSFTGEQLLNANRQAIRKLHYKTLFRESGTDKPSIFLQQRDIHGHSQEFVSSIRSSEVVEDISLILPHQNDLIQLSSFFTGAVYADDPFTPNLGNARKINSLDDLKARFPLDFFSGHYNQRIHNRFLVKYADLD